MPSHQQQLQTQPDHGTLLVQAAVTDCWSRTMNGGASIRLTQDQVYPVVCHLWRQQGRDMELQQRQQAEHGTEAIASSH